MKVSALLDIDSFSRNAIPGEFQHLRTVPLFTVESLLPVRRPFRHLRIEVSPTISVGPTDIVNGDYVRHTNPGLLGHCMTSRRHTRHAINLPAGTGNIAGFSTHSVTHPLQNAS